MKTLIFTDVHITPIKGMALFEETALACMNACMDYAKKYKIKDIWCLGDTWYHKSYYESYLLAKSTPTFERLQEFKTIFLVGNHDVAADKDNKQYNLLTSFKNYIHICEDPYEVREYDGNKFVFINYTSNRLIAEHRLPIDSDKKNVLLAHMDCDGFFTNAKHQMEGSGITIDDVKEFDLVLTGHYHKRAKYGNVQYIGNTHHMRVSDAGNPFGFVVLDTATLEYTFHTYENFEPPCYYEYDLDEMDKIKKAKNSFVTIRLSGEHRTKVPQVTLDELQAHLEKSNHSVGFTDASGPEVAMPAAASRARLELETEPFLENYFRNCQTDLPVKGLLDRVTGKKRISIKV